MAFDVEGALNAGYSEAEVAEYLGKQKNFDAAAAIKAGYQPQEIIEFLTSGKPGFMPALEAGYERLKGEAALTAGKVGLMDVAEAEKYQKAQEEKARGIFKPTEEGWTEAPVAKFKELLGGSLPYMAAPLAAAGAAAALPVTGPAAVAAAGAGAGLASLGQFTGSNLARQMETGKTLEETDLGAAAAAAVPQAALDVVSFRSIPLIRNLFKSVGKELTEAEAKAIAEQGFKRTAADYAMSGAKTATIEGATEAGQQFFERLQAGLSIDDKEARKEYVDNFIGGAVLGGAISPIGRFFERGQEQAKARAQLAAAPSEAPRLGTDELTALRDQYNEAEAKLNDLATAAKAPGLAPEARRAAVEEFLRYKNGTFAPLRLEYMRNKKAIDALAPAAPEAPTPEPLVTLPPEPSVAAPPPVEPIPTEPLVTLPPAAEPPAAPTEPAPTEPPVTPVEPPAVPAEPSGVVTLPPTIEEPSPEPVRDTTEPSPVGVAPKSPEPPAAPVAPPPDVTPPERKEFSIDTPKEQIAKEVKGMTIPELARWAVVNAPNTPAKEIAIKAFDRINEYADRGIFPGKIQIRTGVTRGTGTRGSVKHAYYASRLGAGFDATMTLSGLNSEGKADAVTGTRYETILHELLHSAAFIQIQFDPNSKPVKELKSLYVLVREQIKQDFRAGKSHPALDAIRRGANTMADVHELVSWGLTDHNFQNYLSTIKLGKKTAFTRFVEIMRKLLDISPDYDTALDSLMRSSENLLSTPVTEIEKGIGTPIKGLGYRPGAPAPRVTLPPQAKAPTAAKPGQPPVLDESGVTPAKGRHPQVQAAAKLLQEGKLSREEFEKYVDYYRPIEPIEADKLYPPSTVEKMRDALRGAEAKAKLNTPIADGTRVGLRMDLPAREKGVPVVSIHQGKPNSDPKTGKPYKSAGKVIGYGSTGYLKDVFFAPRDQEKSLVMGMEPSKEPLQTAEGTWVNMAPGEVYRQVKQLMNDPAWSQIGFDPQRHGYFYDRKTREPVASADEMFQVGQFLLAKNVKYAPKEEFLYEAVPTEVTTEERLPVLPDLTQTLFAPQSAEERKQGFAIRLKNPVTLKDGTRLSGFTDPVKQTTFYGYNKNGERITVRREYVNPEDIVFSKDSNQTAKKLKQALIDVEGRGPTEVTTEERTGDVGRDAVRLIDSMGMGVQPPAPSAFQRGKEILKNAGDNPELTKASIKKSAIGFLDRIETSFFSSSSAFDNELRRQMIGDLKQNEDIIGALIDASQSQAVHADALASQFIIEGGLKYDPEAKKWVAYKEPDNFVELGKQLNAIAAKYGITEDESRRVAHTYFVAKRLKSLQERNEQDKKDIEALKAKREAATTKAEKEKLASQIQRLKDREAYIHLGDTEIEAGIDLGEMIPELKDVTDTWNGIRRNVRRVLVNSGLWTEEYADQMLDVIDYVPFYREVQLEENKGPREFVRGLQVQAKEHQLKGSNQPVNDVIDNMVRWTQYAINRSVRNDKAVRMVDAALGIDMIDGTKMAERVDEAKRGMNVVRVWRDGKQELYNMADPLFADAFIGIQNIAIEEFKFMSKVANTLRDSVVLFPLFSLAQVPQDAYAAMFSSGLQPQFALKIPYLAVKEFIKTYRKSSATHEILKKYGAVGVRDFNSTVVRNDAEIFAGLKAPLGTKAKIKEKLQHIAMSADNAVRQAVYEASLDQGLSKAEALEKAFEIINFRRRGTNRLFQIFGQTVPFFYAYLAAMRVSYKTLTGAGISPQERAAGLKTFAYTSAAVMTLSTLYAMLAGDDEDYKKTPAGVRDRTLTIPGTGGMRIPLRVDFFLLPKIIAEHSYLLMTNKGYEDSAKFRKSVSDAIADAVLSPTVVPQAVKPLVEVGINYDFFQKRPVVGTFEQQKELSRQFNEYTSEFSKLVGQTNLVSPIALDHLIRGMGGSVGGLFLWFTNQAVALSNPTIQRPATSTRELIEALPGTSGFLSRTNESALKNDFYQLRDEVIKAVNTFNDIKKNSPEGIDDFLKDEKRMAQLIVGKQVGNINQHLAKLRAQIKMITQMPANQISADQKAEAIKELRKIEEQILESVNVKGMREQARI